MLALVKSILFTILETNKELETSKLKGLQPIFFGLVCLSGVLALLHMVSPIAPFVYSLF
ncbi:MAG: hypothetical protein M9962_11390 [Oligoflexia bacterium]|nr:hypothetical protein [Oligoflexia bacterium]